ncbi:type IX secretion system membrane protein PorP/SprF [Marinilabiliaceae bacterium JC017]|nr:type IX secretion system membrane protein PorP/SprF [Marinilabiliaceae bacterium JC017]
MKRLLRYCWGLLFLFLFGKMEAQDPHFSQFYANPLYLSPSLAGATDGGRLVLNYRNQWPSISTAFSTYAISFDNFFSKFNSGIGFFLMQDKAGSAGLSTTNAAFQYSYNLMLSDTWQVVPAVEFMYGNKAIDFSKLEFGDEMAGGGASGAYDRLNNDQVHYIDLAASVFVYSSKYWVGLTVNHLAQPNFTFLGEEMRMPVKYTLFGGLNIWSEHKRRKGLNRSFSFSFRLQQQDNFNQADLGLYWHNDPIEVGVWYRGLPFGNDVPGSVNQDAIVALVAYNFGPFRMGYSYDITISGLGWQTAGAHELSVIFEFNQRGNLRLGGRRPAVPCSETANPLSSTTRRRKGRHRIF